MNFVLSLIGAVMFCGIFHELGHFILARCFGAILDFKREGFRFTWTMPEEFTATEKRIVAIAGFGLEFLFALPLIMNVPEFGAAYLAVAITHFIAYPFYSAGGASDFNFI